jgi:hypothetical protein
MTPFLDTLFLHFLHGFNTGDSSALFLRILATEVLVAEVPVVPFAAAQILPRFFSKFCIIMGGSQSMVVSPAGVLLIPPMLLLPVIFPVPIPLGLPNVGMW